MAELSIIPVNTAEDLDRFVELPWSIYTPDSLWVPNLKKQDRELLSPGEHPFWKTARRELFLALRDGRPVGRIAAIVDEKYNAYAGERCGAFGFFECQDDREAAHALLQAAHDWLRRQGMAFMRGPLNPSTNYTCAMLVDGFDEAPALMMPWNPPYYPALLESWHMRKEQDLFAYLIERDKLRVEDWLKDEIRHLKEQERFTCRVSSKATLTEDIRIMLDLYRISWAGNWGFAPLSDGEADVLVKELKGLLNPDFFVLFFHDGEPAAGMVALPDFNPLLKRLNGKLGLSALWHYWQARGEMRGKYRMILFGIREEFRLLGLPLLLLDYMLEQARRHPEFPPGGRLVGAGGQHGRQ